MKNLSYISFIFFSLVIFSCNNTPTSKYYSGVIKEKGDFKHNVELKPQLFLKSDSFAFTRVYIVDTLLFLGTGGRSEIGMISIYGKNSKQRLLSICRNGRGENEYSMFKYNAPYICPKTNHIILNTFDGMQIFRQIDITESLKAGEMKISKEEDYGKKYFRQFDYNSKITIFPSGRKILGLNAHQPDYRDKGYSLPKYVVEEDGLSRDIALYPEPLYAEGSNDNATYYGSSSDYKPDGTKIVESLSFIDLISIIDVKSGKVKGLKRKGSPTIEEAFAMSKDALMEQPLGPWSIYASNDYFFAVNLDLKSSALLNPSNMSPNTSIEVYSWDGDAVAKIKVENDKINSLFYDVKSKLLYTVNRSGDIVYYDLNGIL